MRADEENKMEAAIVAKAQRFDIAALLCALTSLDYREVDIEYRSHLTTLHHVGLVHSIEFIKKPRRYVIVTVNIGLLATQNPLPSYFLSVLERQGNESLELFLNFFSHRLLQSQALGLYPERDRNIFPDFHLTRRNLLALLGCKTPSTLHWLFQHAFPELEVALRRGTQQRAINTQNVTLGGTEFGDGSAFGAVTHIPVPSVEVTLFCDEPTSGTGEPWGREAQRRLRLWIFPLIFDLGLFLTVILVFRDQPSWVVLQPDRYLGYQPIYSEAQTTAPKQVRRVVLFNNELTIHTALHGFE